MSTVSSRTGLSRGGSIRVGALAAAAFGAVTLASAGGCYTRVVGARGPGADQYSVSEPYQQDTKLDRWFYGDSDRRNRSLLNERSVR